MDEFALRPDDDRFAFISEAAGSPARICVLDAPLRQLA
jgi:hypothetical protein